HPPYRPFPARVRYAPALRSDRQAAPGPGSGDSAPLPRPGRPAAGLPAAAAAVPVELQRLLDAADIGTDAVIAGLYLIETVVQLGVLIAPLLDLAVGVALLGDHGFQRDFQAAYFLLPLPGLGIQALPAQGLELR